MSINTMYSIPATAYASDQEELRNEVCNQSGTTTVFDDGSIGNRYAPENAGKKVEGDLPKSKFASDQDDLRHELCDQTHELTAYEDGTIGDKNAPENQGRRPQGDLPKSKFACT